MTVASQLKQTLTALKGAAANLDIYSVHHPDPQVKALFQECRRDLAAIVSGINQRLQQIELEEPQYKSY